jgi:hypothetical protein
MRMKQESKPILRASVVSSGRLETMKVKFHVLLMSVVAINCRLVIPAVLTTKQIDSAVPWIGDRLTSGIFVGGDEDENCNVDARNRIAAPSLYRGRSSDSYYFSMQVFITFLEGGFIVATK